MPIPLGANMSVAGFAGQLSLCVCSIHRNHLFVYSSCCYVVFFIVRTEFSEGHALRAYRAARSLADFTYQLIALVDCVGAGFSSAL